MISINKTIWSVLFWSLIVVPVYAAPVVTELKLNGTGNNAELDPSGDWKVDIALSANEPVKWNTISICATSDSVCNRTSAVKYFTQTSNFTTSAAKSWNGQTTSKNPVANGDYKIKVTAKNEAGEETIKEFSSPVITIIAGSGSGVTSGDSNDDSTDQTSDDSDYSVFSTQVEVSSYTKSSKWQIGIGKDRSVLAGARVAFKIDDNAAASQQAIYQWSFGDGARVRGKVASHTYRHPGTYLVVVTADNRAGQEAVARVKVKVSAAKVAVSFLDSTGSVKLANKNGEEINLGSFSLTADEQKPFVFPADTIIGVGQEIVVDESISGLEFGAHLALFDPTGRVVAESGLAADKREETMVKLEQLQSSLREVQIQLAARTTSNRLAAVSAPSANPPSLAGASNTLNTIVLEREGDSLLSWLRKLFKL